jgi:hypothetical protein
MIGNHGWWFYRIVPFRRDETAPRRVLLVARNRVTGESWQTEASTLSEALGIVQSL